MRSFFCKFFLPVAATHTTCFYAGKYQGYKAHPRELQKINSPVSNDKDAEIKSMQAHATTLSFLLLPSILLTEMGEGVASAYLLTIAMFYSHPAAYMLGKRQGELQRVLESQSELDETPPTPDFKP